MIWDWECIRKYGNVNAEWIGAFYNRLFSLPRFNPLDFDQKSREIVAKVNHWFFFLFFFAPNRVVDCVSIDSGDRSVIFTSSCNRVGFFLWCWIPARFPVEILSVSNIDNFDQLVATDTQDETKTQHAIAHHYQCRTGTELSFIQKIASSDLTGRLNSLQVEKKC